MANAFDRFDQELAPSGNYFDRYDENPAPELKPKSALQQGFEAYNAAKNSVPNRALEMAYNLTPLGLIQQMNDQGNRMVKNAADYGAEKVFEATNSPELATATKFSPEIASLAVSPFLSGKLPQMLGGGENSAAAARIGVNPTWGQRSGNPAVLATEDVLRRMPGSGWVFGANDVRNQQGVNQAAAKAIGQKAKYVTSDVINNASNQLDDVRTALRADVSIPANEQTIPMAADRAKASFNDSLSDMPEAFTKAVDKIKSRLKMGKVDGNTYQKWRTDLRDAKEAAYNAKNSTLGNAYDEVLSALDDAARGNASKEWVANDVALSNLELLQKGNVVNTVTGDVSPANLANAFFSKFKKAAKQDKLKGEIPDIVKAQRAYPKWAEGSPTGKTDQYTGLVPWLLSPATAAAAKVLTSNPYNLLRYAPYAGPASLTADDVRILGLLPPNEQ